VLIACWSAKGGAGTTVIAAALAVLLARREANGVLAVDLAGDLPAALGMHEPTGPALTDWLAADGEVPADALARMEQPAAPSLALIHRGLGPLGPDRAGVLARLLAAEPRIVVADCGRIDASEEGAASGTVARALVAGASSSLLVTRACFLALRRAAALELRPTGVVLLVEEGRAIGAPDIESVLGVSVVAKVRVSLNVARAVDAGLLASSLPRSLQRELDHAA
jgi:hypothetical protein